MTSPDGRADIRSLTLPALTQALEPLGFGADAALRVWKALWQGGVADFGDIKLISKAARATLAQHFYLYQLTPHRVLDSADGTRKFVWELADGSLIESVLIPDPGEGLVKDRLTLCVSSQVGCAMSCRFCLTGDLGLKRNLRPSEIAQQPLQVGLTLPPGQRITNIVFMGMGEPLHNLDNLIVALGPMMDDNALNLSHRRITVSTVGLVPQMAKLAAQTPVNLAVSLNATTNEQRLRIMPITKRYPLDVLMDACRSFPQPHAKRITFEYVMMEGFNCELEDAERLVHLMRSLPSKLNLIPYNENPNRDILRPSEAKVRAFQHILVNEGIQCSVRTTRGIDISAACGQLGKGGEGEFIPEAAGLPA